MNPYKDNTSSYLLTPKLVFKVDTTTAKDTLDYCYNLNKPDKFTEDNYNKLVVDHTQSVYSEYIKLNERLKKKQKNINKLKNDD